MKTVIEMPNNIKYCKFIGNGDFLKVQPKWDSTRPDTSYLDGKIIDLSNFKKYKNVDKYQLSNVGNTLIIKNKGNFAKLIDKLFIWLPCLPQYPDNFHQLVVIKNHKKIQNYY